MHRLCRSFFVLLSLVGCSAAGGGSPPADGGTTSPRDGGRTTRDGSAAGTDGFVPREDGGTTTGTWLEHAPYGTSECDDADVIDLGSVESVSMTVNTSSGSDHSTTSATCSAYCSGGGAPDTVFRYVPPRSGTLVLRTDGSATTVGTTVLTLFASCDGAVAPIATCDAHTRPYRKRLAYGVQAGQPLYIAVDGCTSDDAGDIQLDLDLVDSLDAGPGSDACASATALTFHSIGGEGDLTFRYAEAFGEIDSGSSPDVAATCATGADRVYRFDAEAYDELRVRVEPLTGGFDPAIVLLRDCTEVEDLCQDARTPGASDTLDTNVLSNEGTWQVAVKSADGSTGRYRLSVTLGESD